MFRPPSIQELRYRIAQYITSESAPVTALHFSSNQISILGVFKLLTMLSLHPLYPLETSLHGKASFIPLWLQLDNNNITDEDLQDFLDFHLRELGCAICLVGKHCSLWTCQCVKQMKMDDRKHNAATGTAASAVAVLVVVVVVAVVAVVAVDRRQVLLVT